MTTKVLMPPIGNPLPDERKISKVIELDGNLDRVDVFAKLYPELSRLGHIEDSRIVPQWSIIE